MVRLYIVALIANCVLGATAAITALWLLVDTIVKAKYSPLVFLFTALAVGFFLQCIWASIRFMRGKVLHRANALIPVNNGQFAIPEYHGDYEVWVFCRGSFSQFHGEVSIKTSSEQMYSARLARRIPLLHSVRKSPGPLIISMRNHGVENTGMSVMYLRLLPSFAGTPYDFRSQPKELEFVEVLIKAKPRFLRCHLCGGRTGT